jgi:hypothetical protein
MSQRTGCRSPLEDTCGFVHFATPVVCSLRSWRRHSEHLRPKAREEIFEIRFVAVIATRIPRMLRYFAARLEPFSYNNQRIACCFEIRGTILHKIGKR